MKQLYTHGNMHYFILILFLLLITNLYANNHLIIDDSTYTIYGGPLMAYYRPFFETEDSLMYQSYTTAIGSDRYSTWEIKNDSLRLLRIEQVIKVPTNKFASRYETGSRIIPADSIFMDKDYPVFADWYSDTILLPTGKRLPFGHMGRNGCFETGVYIVFKNGCIIDRVNFNNQGLDLYRSGEDIDWCGLKTVETNCENWLDGRLFSDLIINEIIDTNKVFKTRGIAIRGDFDGGFLVVPETPMTEEVNLRMEPFPIDNNIIDSAFVEIEANLCNTEDDYIQIEVIHFRMLDSSESIHSARYPMYRKILKLVEDN